MTEKEKMLSGACYNSRDKELLEIYHKARKLIKEYSNLDLTDTKKRNRIYTASHPLKLQKESLNPRVIQKERLISLLPVL